MIVCYGAWTADQLAANPEFAYSLNRLVRSNDGLVPPLFLSRPLCMAQNVSITRARKKCILLLSDAMLTPTAAVLDDARAKKGFFYLKQLMHHAKVLAVGHDQ